MIMAYWEVQEIWLGERCNQNHVYLHNFAGCGKTTLLSSIVGLRNWDSGDIFVFGSRPGTKGTGMLGRRLGFMPQEIALYDQLSIKEMIEYYGRLYNMADKDVADQLLFIVDFLKLPSKFRLIKDLSGGEQRRVSISLTLLHSPELLILDEPVSLIDSFNLE
ncbi:ABC transporter G family member 23 [Orchesella cincta]|uniref:ABC transporter G family member 23 n=1 Tax=Orchesella cincta TaxID=48709 RepID=A0A1D2NGL2_ORCCI|nr:ABC transporter G family member 23 [Orchesella cincta]